MIKVFVPCTRKDEKVIIVGSSSRLGEWKPELGLLLTCISPFYYKQNIKFDENEQWKLVIIDSANNVTWEEGENRISNPDSTICFRGGRKATGIMVPLYSLRGSNDNGIGDFHTLELFIKQISKDGHKIVQLLPIHDTWKDKIPYHNISAFALNPIYICLDKMGSLEDVEIAHSIADRTIQVTYSNYVEWDDVLKIKWDYFEAIYCQDGDKTINSKPFQKFFDKEKEWIIPYASFCYLSEKFGTNDFDLWGDEYSCYSGKIFNELTKDSEVKKRVFFYIFLQYHAFNQLISVKKTANKVGVALCCNIAAGLFRNSCDIWVNPRMTDRTVIIGKEPDSTNISGIKYHYCPINWNYSKDWCLKRLKHSNRFFDICSLEYIKNLFRIWTVPNELQTALKGYYVPSRPYSEKFIHKSGFQFDSVRDLKPRLTKEYILKFIGKDFKRFGEFFKKDENDFYNFKPNMSRHCDLVNYFKSRKGNEDELMNMLMRLQDECLFVNVGNNYIPRIAAQYTNTYLQLSEDQKNIFNKLYDNYYYNSSDIIWEKNGLKCLKFMTSKTNILYFTECFDDIPNFMLESVKKMGILPVIVERDLDVGSAQEFPYMSVATTSNFSMYPIRKWWTKHGEQAQKYWNETLHHNGKAPEIANQNVCMEIIQRTLTSSSAFSFIHIIDWQSIMLNNITNDSNHTHEMEEHKHDWTWRIDPTFTLPD